MSTPWNHIPKDRLLEKGWKAIRAIRCTNDIVAKLQEFERPEELEKYFSDCIEKCLKAHLGKKMVTAFWSHGNKGSPGEMTRHYVDDLRYPEGSPEYHKRELLRAVIVERNSDYDSVPFFEVLIRQGVGTSHVFSISPENNCIQFAAHPELEKRTVNAPPHALAPVTSTHRWVILAPPSPEVLSPAAFLASLKDSLGDTGPEAKSLASEKIKAYCDCWRDTSEQMTEQIIEAFPGIMGVDGEIVRSACGHFALLMLYAINYDFAEVSYILAAGRSGAWVRGSPSSMVIFWPDRDDVRYEDVGLPFQLQMILGQGALRVGQSQRLAAASYGLAHPLKHRLGRLDALAEGVANRCQASGDAQLASESMELRMDVRHAYDFAEMAHMTHLGAVEGWEAVYKAMSHNQPKFAARGDLKLQDMAEDLCRRLGQGANVLLELKADPADRWILTPFHNSSANGEVRLNNSVYEELLFEVLTNLRWHGVERDGRKTARATILKDFLTLVAAEAISAEPVVGRLHGVDALVFANDVSNPREEIRAERWKKWGHASATGMTFVKDCLEVANAGALFYRFDRPVGSADWVFEVALILRGLNGTGHT